MPVSRLATPFTRAGGARKLDVLALVTIEQPGADGLLLQHRGMWRPATGEVPAAFTRQDRQRRRSPDLAPIHDRQMVVLERDDWLAWLELSRPEAELLKPLPECSLHVEQVR